MTDTVLYFKKLAKSLNREVEAQDPKACMRVRAVFRDTVSVPDAGVAAQFGLMRAQHVIAVEHGFKDWNDLQGRRQIELQLAITLAREPELNDAGMGLSREDWRKPGEERDRILQTGRAQIWTRIDAIELAVPWLKEKVKPIKTFSTWRTTYGTKHIAEPDIGYISNGGFTAALLIAGYAIKRDPDSLNSGVALSERSLKSIQEERRKRTKPYGWMRQA